MMFRPKAAKMAKSIAVSGPHAAMRNEHGAVLVRHPSLPGKDMRPASPDYAELPAGSISKHNAAGGITGGLAPYQSLQGAESGEYSNG